MKLRNRKRRLKVTGVAILVASVPGQGYLGERHKGYVWGEGIVSTGMSIKWMSVSIKSIQNTWLRSMHTNVSEVN